MIFFFIPVFSSNFPRKSVTMFFSFRNFSARSAMDEKKSSRPMVLNQVLKRQRSQRKTTCSGVENTAECNPPTATICFNEGEGGRREERKEGGREEDEAEKHFGH